MSRPTSLLYNTAYTSYTSSTEISKKRKISEESCLTSVATNYDGQEISKNTTKNSSYSTRNFSVKVELDAILRKECDGLVQLMDEAKLWLIISSHSIEGTTEVQEDVLMEMQRAQESALNIRDASRKYHFSRAKICSKMIKYPSLEDYRLALDEYDEQHLYLAHQHLRDIRNIYVVLNDLVKRCLVSDL